MLCSGNDAAVALAEYCAGSVENFAILMNNKANDLSLQSTHFVTPHGLDNADHYTTVSDFAFLCDYDIMKAGIKIPDNGKPIRKGGFSEI